jgi:hypothetical protein
MYILHHLQSSFQEICVKKYVKKKWQIRTNFTAEADNILRFLWRQAVRAPITVLINLVSFKMIADDVSV